MSNIYKLFGGEILPYPKAGGARTGGLINITADEITRRLGFGPNVADDPSKVVNSWGFTVDGKICGVWDYKGSHLLNQFSTFGPADKLKAVFGSHYDDQRRY